MTWTVSETELSVVQCGRCQHERVNGGFPADSTTAIYPSSIFNASIHQFGDESSKRARTEADTDTAGQGQSLGSPPPHTATAARQKRGWVDAGSKDPEPGPIAHFANFLDEPKRGWCGPKEAMGGQCGPARTKSQFSCILRVASSIRCRDTRHSLPVDVPRNWPHSGTAASRTKGRARPRASLCPEDPIRRELARLPHPQMRWGSDESGSSWFGPSTAGWRVERDGTFCPHITKTVWHWLRPRTLHIPSLSPQITSSIASQQLAPFFDFRPAGRRLRDPVCVLDM